MGALEAAICYRKVYTYFIFKGDFNCTNNTNNTNNTKPTVYRFVKPVR